MGPERKLPLPRATARTRRDAENRGYRVLASLTAQLRPDGDV